NQVEVGHDRFRHHRLARLHVAVELPSTSGVVGLQPGKSTPEAGWPNAIKIGRWRDDRPPAARLAVGHVKPQGIVVAKPGCIVGNAVERSFAVPLLDAQRLTDHLADFFNFFVANRRVELERSVYGHWRSPNCVRGKVARLRPASGTQESAAG